MGAAGSTPVPPWTAGCAPIASRAWMDSGRSHGPTWGVVRRHPELLEEAARLRQEIPGRSAAQISAILQARHGVRVAERTIRAHLQRRGLQRAVLAGASKAYGRFEADRPNELWIGDVLVGPFVPHPRQAGSQRAYLFLLVDDYSRLLVHARRCCARPSSAVAYPSGSTWTTAPLTRMPHSRAPARFSASASSIAARTHPKGGASRSDS